MHTKDPKTSKSPNSLQSVPSGPAAGLPDELVEHLGFDPVPEVLEEELLLECEAAPLVGLDPRDLRELRKRGDGPTHYEYPLRGIRYRRADLTAYQLCKRRGLEWGLALQVTIGNDPRFPSMQQHYEMVRAVVEEVVTEMLVGEGGEVEGEG